MSAIMSYSVLLERAGRRRRTCREWAAWARAADPEKYRAYQREHGRRRARPQSTERWRAYRRAWHQGLRGEALRALGGKCVRCGYRENSAALQIDHVNGDGFAERKTMHQRELYKKVAAVGTDGGRYQLLCANCNVIKRMERGEHYRGFEGAIS